VTIACAARGIHRDTFYKWLEDHPDFVRALASARQRKIREWITAGR
jgi:CRP-like cAMP-binding protein